MSDLIPWEEHCKHQTKVEPSLQLTAIACPCCGKALYKRTDIVLTCFPPKYEYLCRNCNWNGYA